MTNRSVSMNLVDGLNGLNLILIQLLEVGNPQLPQQSEI